MKPSYTRPFRGGTLPVGACENNVVITTLTEITTDATNGETLMRTLDEIRNFYRRQKASIQAAVYDVFEMLAIRFRFQPTNVFGFDWPALPRQPRLHAVVTSRRGRRQRQPGRPNWARRARSF